MQNLHLPTRDSFADAFENFQKTALFARLSEKFELKPYYRKYKPLRLVVLVASYFLQVFSALTAAALVFFFVRGLTGHALVSALATIVILTLLEFSKRGANAIFWRDLLQFKRVGALGLTVLLLSGLSIASSYFGAQRAVVEFTAPAKVVNADSAAADITAQIAAIDQQINDARATRWNNTTTRTSQRTIDRLTQQKTVLLDELTRTRSRVDQINDTTTAEHTRTTRLSAQHFALFTLLLDLLFIVCAFYLEYYDFRSLAEFATPDETRHQDAQRTPTGNAKASAYSIPYQADQDALQHSGNGTGNGMVKDQVLPIGFFVDRSQDQAGTNAMRYNEGDQAGGEVVEVDTASRPCDHCGTYYKPRTTWQRFCTVDCREAYHAEKHDGTAFDPSQYRRKRRRNVK